MLKTTGGDRILTAMRGWVAGLTLAFGMAATSGTLIAYSGPDYAKLKALLPPGPDAALCLSRTYDADHLNKHKQQQVTALVLLIRYVVLSDDDAILVATEDGGIRKQHFRYDFTLAAKVRDRRETFYASGDCASEEAIGCGVECDGGGIEVEPVAGGNGAVLVRLERIRMTQGCSEGDAVDLEGGADDKVFKLSTAPRSLCNAMQSRAEKSLQ
jgi:hypothetical protein